MSDAEFVKHGKIVLFTQFSGHRKNLYYNNTAGLNGQKYMRIGGIIL
jgi:hypothetical protein